MTPPTENSTTKAKICGICGKELPIDEFYTAPRNKDGHMGRCKECHKQRAIKNRIGARAIATSLKGSPNSPLADFTPRQLIDELRSRGYKGKLEYTHIITL